MHRLQLAMGLIQLLERGDSEEDTISAGAEERDGRIQEAVDIQSMDMPGRGDLSRERQVPFEEKSHVLDPGIIDSDNKVHAWFLTRLDRDGNPLANNPLASHSDPSACRQRRSETPCETPGNRR